MNLILLLIGNKIYWYCGSTQSHLSKVELVGCWAVVVAQLVERSLPTQRSAVRIQSPANFIYYQLY